MVCAGCVAKMIGGLAMTAPAATCTDIADRNLVNRHMGGGGDIAHCNTVVDDFTLVDVEIIDDGCVIVNLRDLSWSDAIITGIRAAEISCRHE